MELKLVACIGLNQLTLGNIPLGLDIINKLTNENHVIYLDQVNEFEHSLEV